MEGIKIRLRGNGKAMVKFTHPIDEQFFVHILRMHRDDGQPHPKIILKNKDGGNIPKLPPPQKPADAVIAENKAKLDKIKIDKNVKVMRTV